MRVTRANSSNLNAALMGLFAAAVILAASSRAHGAEAAKPDHEKFHAARLACETETGVKKPEKGQRPSDADREKMEACLSKKGFTKPPHPPGPRGERPPPPPAAGEAPPAPPAPGEAPPPAPES